LPDACGPARDRHSICTARRVDCRIRRGKSAWSGFRIRGRRRQPWRRCRSVAGGRVAVYIGDHHAIVVFYRVRARGGAFKATSIGIPTELTVIVCAAFNFVAAAVSYPAGDLSDRWGRKRLFVGALGIFIVAYVGLAVSVNPLVASALFVLYGAYQGVFRSVGKAFATDLVPEQARATGIGLYASTVGLAALVASTVGGQLWVQVGPSATFLYGAVFAVLGALLLVALVPGNPRRT
jgi:MFS family permease